MPVPSGPSIFYSATIDAPALAVYAGDFTGTSTASFGIGANGRYANGQNDGLEVPFGVALGPNGNLYTLETIGAQATSASVAEYLPNFNCMGPVAMLDGLPVGGSTPGAVAVDAAGYVYVASQLPRQLALYAPLVPGTQSAQPLATIAIPAHEASSDSRAGSDPIGIALDASGRIYVADGFDDSVLVYPARSGGTLSTVPSATIAGSTTMLGTVADVALDAAGKIYVVDDTYPYGVKIFAANPSGAANVSPVAQIAGSQTQIFYPPVTVAVDHLGVIYVGDFNNSGPAMIVEFPANPTGTLNEAPQGALFGKAADLVAK